MSKARDIADLVSAGSILADGAIATTEITGVTATSAELNILDGVTATASELNALDGITATATELNYTDGVTSNIQTQLDAKAPTANPTFTGDATFATDTLFVDESSGRVGIGTTSPVSDLHISDSFAGNRTITLPSSTGYSASINMGPSTDYDAGQLSYVNGINDYMLFTVEAAERMRINSSGIDVTGTADMDTLSIGGTAVTATAAELNLLDGVTATTTELNYNDITTLGTSQASKAVTADSNGNVKLTEELQTTCYLETVVALSGTSPTVDCDEANSFTLSTSGNTTFTFSYAGVNLTTNDAYGFTLKITAGGTHTLTWPGSVDWAGGTAPDAPASGETDVYVFYTVDGGTNWYGALAIDAAA